MEALLIIAGAVFAVLGWLWLVVRSLRLGLGKMLVAFFLAPLTLIMHGLGYPLWPRLLVLFGLVCLISGTGWLYQQQPEKMELLLSGGWAATAPDNKALYGTITGQTFTPERVFWREHDLVFEEGSEQRVRRSIVIRFNSAPELRDGVSLERLPNDGGAWPELLLQWYSGALSEPGLRRLGKGYSLSLNLADTDSGLVQGHIYLQLPATYGTWLTGHFELPTAPDWLFLPPAKSDTESVPPVIEEETAAVRDQPAWQAVGSLALLSEPELFQGDTVRLTTESGRRHQGIFKQLSASQRLILAKPQGPHQVELHFDPVDILFLEVRTPR